MQLPSDYQPEFESLVGLLLEMAEERSLENLLPMIVKRFAKRPHIALARIWLIGPGDSCASCDMEPECFHREKCLHLVASAGNPLPGDNTDWSKIDGNHSRVPLGYEFEGKPTASGESFELQNLDSAPRWFLESDLVKRHGVVAMSAEPLIYRQEVMGRLAVFSRIEIPASAQGRGWLRLVADHAAAAISNARAFTEIERLKRRLELENAYLRQEVREAAAFDQIIGQSQALDMVKEQIEQVAPTDAIALIQGETGTGKELVAREIHRKSLRRERPMIKVNCPSIPKELWESEFFGHVKGSFTGAVKDRQGRFELADEGTLFLDEIGEIPLDLQSRLLRVLQEGQFERVGDEITRKVNVRVIAATNRDLQRDVIEGRFRQDLFYRLNVFPIWVPRLADHKEDIALLAQHFIKLTSAKLNRRVHRISPSDMRMLTAYDWPGNVRELKNVIERAMITAPPDAPDLRIVGVGNQAILGSASYQASHFDESAAQKRVLSAKELKRLEKENILNALEKSRWKVYGPGGAAELLGMKPTTLSSRMTKLKISKVTG